MEASLAGPFTWQPVRVVNTLGHDAPLVGLRLEGGKGVSICKIDNFEIRYQKY